MNYRVSWEIDVDAKTFEEAAELAWAHMRRAGSTANVFDVTNEAGAAQRVDLQEVLEARS